MTSVPFDKLLQPLHQKDPPRVWSLLVTVFGDLAQSENTVVSSSVLNTIALQVRLKPEATRVALHRLRKDGWIEGQRNGRRSSYHLTPWGRAQSAAASPLIYASAPHIGRAWLLLRDPASDAERSPDGIWINATVGLAGARLNDKDILSIEMHEDGQIPDWISQKLCPDPLRTAADDFCATLTHMRSALAQAAPLAPMQVATLRVLIVHEWRRIVLRVPDLPDHVFPADWKGAQCRAQVADLLDRLPRPSMDALNKDASVQDAA